MATVVIRRAAPDEDWAVHRLFEALHRFNAELDPHFALADGWGALLDAHRAGERATGSGATLLAWAGDRPVGLLMMGAHQDSPLFRHRRWAELLALYVEPGARSGPLARDLLEAGMAWAREAGHTRVQLYVTASNQRAKRFYARAGFRCVQEIWRLDLAGADESHYVELGAASPRRQALSARQHQLAGDSDASDG